MHKSPLCMSTGVLKKAELGPSQGGHFFRFEHFSFFFPVLRFSLALILLSVNLQFHDGPWTTIGGDESSWTISCGLKHHVLSITLQRIWATCFHRFQVDFSFQIKTKHIVFTHRSHRFVTKYVTLDEISFGARSPGIQLLVKSSEIPLCRISYLS